MLPVLCNICNGLGGLWCRLAFILRKDSPNSAKPSSKVKQ
ncbi:hypothetical protein APS_1716 [Acetobacter pasteurianus subsp. pasteurianus LMG 1262 = NBRC 106471]|nr:hypothetical protein APS_1716 [Acetobacter pasteurianus subsp. pasteurianus LMG 1262 = NBRC 106471]